MNKVDLVILAGGKGTRIKRLLANKPKPMAQFNKKFFIEYIIQNLINKEIHSTRDKVAAFPHPPVCTLPLTFFPHYFEQSRF